MTTIQSQNTAWGFYGTIAHRADAQLAWGLAVETIAEVTGDEDGETYIGIRDFLDSTHGRHFADDVANELHGDPLDIEQAIARAAAKWNVWTINRHTQRDHGIPRGLPYLEAWVLHYQILADIAAEEAGA